LHRPYFEAVASSGRGVIETLRDISSLTLGKIKEALEHATVSAQNLAVHFDVDASHQIFKMKDLPMKKISMEALPAVEAGHGQPQKNESATAAVDREQAGVASEKIFPEEQISKSLGSLLSKFEDPTRITKIEKITGADGRLTVDIKDNDGRLLRSFAVELAPETRKVNIILDVKN
jgi:hypothetical protein